jgi:DNA gyrase inhibitor GyrI
MRRRWLFLGVAVLAVGVGVVAARKAAAVEQAPYTVELSDGAFEIRQYPRLVVAEVSRRGSRESAVNSAFRSLFDYISGKGRSGEEIAMTAPVTQSASIPMTAPVTQSAGAAGAWTVAFVMPSGSTVGTLPEPTGGDVSLDVRPRQRMAAVRFSGRWTDSNFADKEAELVRWMQTRGLSPAGPPVYAYYDPPFKPWFMRHNEVLIPIAAS